MNPNNTPQSDLFNIWTVYNPDNKPFEVYYDSELHKTIQPGKAVQMVKMIANRAVDHLIDRMIKKSVGVAQKNDPALRTEWRSKILLDDQMNNLPVTPTLKDQAVAINATLADNPINVPLPPQATNPTTVAAPVAKFDPFTGEPIKAKPEGITPDQVDVSNVEIQKEDLTVPNVAIPAPVHPDAETNNILSNMRTSGEEKTLPEQKMDADEEPAKLEPTRPLEPTKEDLLSYAKDVLLMDISDATTRSELESQSVEELKATLKYDPYA